MFAVNRYHFKLFSSLFVYGNGIEMKNDLLRTLVNVFYSYIVERFTNS